MLTRTLEYGHHHNKDPDPLGSREEHPQHSQEINSNQIKPVKQPLLLEGLPTAKATLVQYKAKPGLSGIFHLQKGQPPCPQSLPYARMLEGSPPRTL